MIQVFPISDPNSQAAPDVADFRTLADVPQLLWIQTGSSISSVPVQQSLSPSDVKPEDIFFNTSAKRPYKMEATGWESL